MLKCTVTQQDAALVNSVNQAVCDVCQSALEAAGLVVFEQALIATGLRKSRNLIQWRAIQRELESLFGRGVITISGAELLRQTKNDDRPLRLTKQIKEAIDRYRGNRAAGFCFPASNPNVAYRQIAARRHVADGLNTSANNLESQVPQLPESFC